jgi:hypothetical protein
VQVSRTTALKIGDIIQSETTTLTVGSIEFRSAESVDALDRAIIRLLDSGVIAKSLDEWHEDLGPVLWWTSPIVERPYCGTPNDSDWPGYHTHWTPLVVPTNLNT